jgi:hypothetical protein
MADVIADARRKRFSSGGCRPRAPNWHRIARLLAPAGQAFSVAAANKGQNLSFLAALAGDVAPFLRKRARRVAPFGVGGGLLPSPFGGRDVERRWRKRSESVD